MSRATKPKLLPGERLCTRCNGSGHWVEKYQLCFKCEGSGKIIDTRPATMTQDERGHD